MQWRVVAGLALTLVVATVQAGPSPQGRWQTIDDETGKAKSVVELQVSGEGQLSGRVVELLNHPGQDNPLCEACEGERHAQPIKGMTILWGCVPTRTATGWAARCSTRPRARSTRPRSAWMRMASSCTCVVSSVSRRLGVRKPGAAWPSD